MISVRRALASCAVGAIAFTALIGCVAGPAEPDGPLALRIGTEPGAVGVSPNPMEGVLTYDLGWEPAYESLFVNVPGETEYGPWLASEFTLSEDRMALDLVLREDVDFTDGTHLDAHALKDYLDIRFADGAAYLSLLELEPEVEVTAEYGVRITTSAPINDGAMYELSLLPIASPEAARNPDESFAEGPVGTGPYVLDEWIPEVSMSFVRNPDYWNPDAFDFDTVMIMSFADRVAALNALRSGQIDVAAIDPASAAEAESAGLTVHAGHGALVVLMLNAGDPDTPALADPRVRRAISLAIDREGIAETVDNGYGRVSSQIGNVGQPHYVEGGDDRFDYDPDRARDLLAEAGYATGFEVTIPTVAGAPVVPQQYQPILQQLLGDIGIRVEYVAQPDLGAALASVSEFQMLLLRPAYADLPRVMFLSPPVFPRGLDEDPTAARLWKDVVNGTVAESADASAGLGELILDDAWIIPISHPTDVWASTPDIALTPNTVNSKVQLRMYEAVGR